MKILDLYRHFKTKRSFRKNAILGKNVQFGNAGCNCSSQSKCKQDIIIGENSFINGIFCTQANGKIVVGDHFYLGANSMLGAINSIKIGKCVIISNDVKIYDNNNHPTSPKARMEMSLGGFSNDNWQWKHSASAPIVIEDNVWVGQYSTILKGVTIGKGSIVATRAVVTKDVPPYSIVAGNPAKVVKKIECE